MASSAPLIGAVQSALTPHGAEASAVAELTALLVGGAAVIFVVVMALAVLAVFSPRAWLGSRALIVGGGIVFPLVVLSALHVHSLLAAPRLASRGAADLVVELFGQQWWWRVDYLGPAGEADFSTANEIHVPVGAIVELRLRSADVLHSFWVPALAGKLDLIPGKDNRLRLRADAPGIYRGQCAEYCGGPHAQMALLVVAEAPAHFAAWQRAQREPARRGRQRVDEARGEALFLAHCASCHTVRGTPAAGILAPDLTHFASRASLGAAILPNQPAAVAAWISGNQHVKPGNLMPEFRAFSPDELAALVAYLGSLE